MLDVLLYLVVAAAAGLLGYRLATVFTHNRMRERETRASAETAQLARRLGELETDRARMAAVLSGMVEGVLAVDGDGRLRLANDAARRMLKLDSDLLGRHYVEAVRQPGIVGQLGAALKGEQRLPIEVPLAAVSAAGGPRIFRVQATPATAEGGGAVLVLHDISDLRMADRVRRDFVANVSHELRTPLTAVRGYVEALMDGPIEPEKQRQFLEVIDRHTGRMERLVRDLLRLARLDAQQEIADVQTIEVATLFGSASSDLSERIERQRLHIDVKVKPAAAVIKADPTKMHDALRNLLENAVNYSAEGAHIELEAHADGDRVLLSVSDHGPGIPDADLSRVFERFYRVDKSRTSDPGGTGLGLSIVRHLVELHGGTASAANRPEGGAVFTIALPHKRTR
jgi:two-component system, OmpR family, phosphate regulon sensor histidine kinase PhoR